MRHKKKYIIEINDAKLISYNDYSNLHWTKKKEYKDQLRLDTDQASDFLSLVSGYNLYFKFIFKKRAYDTINVFHMIKIIEDKIFKQDKDNGKICVETEKGSENKIIIKLTKI